MILGRVRRGFRGAKGDCRLSLRESTSSNTRFLSRQPTLDTRAVARLADDVASAAGDFGAALHAGETEMSAGDLRHIETAPIVRHAHDDTFATRRDGDLGGGRLGMAHDVV